MLINPWISHWALAIVKGIREPHEVKKKSFDLDGNWTHDLRIRSTVTLPTVLRGRTEKIGDDVGGESRRRESKGVVIHGGFISTLIYTSELILCFTIHSKAVHSTYMSDDDRKIIRENRWRMQIKKTKEGQKLEALVLTFRKAWLQNVKEK